MPPKKKYKIHCPAPDCTGGRPNRLIKIQAIEADIPAEILNRTSANDVIYRCSYCGLVWAQSPAKTVGFDVIPLGFYDNFTAPNKFIAVRDDYQIRKENKSY
ncbi:MAG: hypothetical protein NTW14_03455 [bacterium]|nr:hypothetical protein [bacterium]